MASVARPALGRPAERTRDGSDAARLVALEQSVERLTRATELLMERGQLPLSPEKTRQLEAQLADASRTAAERMQALRLLRRNNLLNDLSVQTAVAWLQSATNDRTRESILQQLNGQRQGLLRDPLLRLAATDANPEIREQAIDNLRHFVSDPHVEGYLWQTLLSDPDRDARRQAEESLIEGPKDAARLASLRQRALNPQATVDERVTALRALREADSPFQDVVASLMDRAQVSPNPEDRARVYDAIDGLNDPALLVPLVNGLQDPNPSVRERAADALSGFASEAAVRQWLQYVAQNDAEADVRREASRALGERRR